MTDPARSRAAPIGRIGAAALLIAGIGAALAASIATRAFASPDGAEWNSAADPTGCLQCHLDAPTSRQSDALALKGLPRQPEPGQSYLLTVEIHDPALRNSGFLLSVLSADTAAGAFEAVDDRTETRGAQARSNYASSAPDEPGQASWQLVWTAPAAITGPLNFDLWANAGNYDLSPLGDRLHHRVWTLPLEP